MKNTPSLEELIAALRCLPGVGAKSAQRMAFHLLQRDRQGAARLGHALTRVLEVVAHCERCNNFSETPVCALCASPQRDPTLLCVVETPADLVMLGQAQCYAGLYFVLMGRLSPLDGIGPKDIHLDRMIERLVKCVEAGADAIFPEAITDLPMYRKVRDAVGVPVLANITEFGKTPLYTRDELGSVGVDIVLHCCSAYRAMNLAALEVYQAIRRDGTQKNVVGRMQTRDDLYRFLDYHAYELKLDSLFAAEKEKK